MMLSIFHVTFLYFLEVSFQLFTYLLFIFEFWEVFIYYEQKYFVICKYFLLVHGLISSFLICIKCELIIYSFNTAFD